MAGLTADEIKAKNQQAVKVGEGKANGLLVQQVVNGHIVKTYFESREYAPSDDQ